MIVKEQIITKEDIFNKITSLCREVFNNSQLILTLSSSAEEIDEWDSLSHIQLILEIEKTFKVRFSLGELQDLKNIESLVFLVDNKSNDSIE